MKIISKSPQPWQKKIIIHIILYIIKEASDASLMIYRMMWVIIIVTAWLVYKLIVLIYTI